MATLKDVALDAGVSIATVSCCISGKRGVKPETKARIMDSIDKLKYVPNIAARNLKMCDSRQIGMVLPNIDEPYHTEIFKGVSTYFQTKGYNVNIAYSNNSPEQEIEIINTLIGQNVCGLILISCQPENTVFFQSRILDYHIPTVFVERAPDNLYINYAGFDNYKTTYYITDHLLKNGYTSIGLICGPIHFSSEKAAMDGYRDAFIQHGKTLNRNLICTTDMSKEGAFRSSLKSISRHRLQAIISTSELISQGAIEAFSIRGYRIPEHIQFFTFSEENWTNTSDHSGILKTARTAFTLGTKIGELLLKNANSKALFDPQTIILDDPIIEKSLHTAPICSLQPILPITTGTSETLRVLMVDFATSHSVQTLSENFTRQTGIILDFDFLPQDQILNRILNTRDDSENNYDIYMYDVPWLNYMVQNSLLMNISDFVTNGNFKSGHVFKENLDNCQFDGSYFGVPIVGGTQILFYRRDLFENRDIIRQFKKNYQISLRPPKTWTEFNGISSFFTKSCNPDSPTTFGTSLAGITDEELAPELLIRLWAYNGSLWDSYNRPTLNTSENAKAFESILCTLNYVSSSPFETSITQTVNDFTSGKTAMLITYSEYASKISEAIHENVIGKVGYEVLPGRRPASIGWNMGLHPLCKKENLAYLFFNWLCQYDTSYYITILDGQSPVTAPYHSMELLKLYPWLSMTERSFAGAKKRTGPYRKNALIIPQNKIEHILCNVLRDTLNLNMSIPDALQKNQIELKRLFEMYGYPRPFCH